MLVLIRDEVNQTTRILETDMTEEDIEVRGCGGDYLGIDPERDKDVLLWTTCHKMGDRIIVRFLPGGAVSRAERRLQQVKESVARCVEVMTRDIIT